jgi:hypothetical protein
MMAGGSCAVITAFKDGHGELRIFPPSFEKKSVALPMSSDRSIIGFIDADGSVFGMAVGEVVFLQHLLMSAGTKIIICKFAC